MFTSGAIYRTTCDRESVIDSQTGWGEGYLLIKWYGGIERLAKGLLRLIVILMSGGYLNEGQHLYNAYRK